MKKLTLVLMCVLMPLMLTGCFKSKIVPPGKIVMVLDSSGEQKVYTKGSYTAYGRDRVYFIDTKLKSKGEKMQILCADDINMDVDIKWVGSFSSKDQALQIIKEKVPATKLSGGDDSGYELSLDQFYKLAMKDIIRAKTREEVAKYQTENIRDNRGKIQTIIKSEVLKRFNELKYPVITTDVMISNLDYPKEITDQRKEIKRAQLEDAKQEALAIAAIKQAEREAGIAREEGKAQIERAKADAAANNIRAKSLTPAIIQMRQWDVLSKGISLGEGDLMLIPYDMANQSDMAAIRHAIKQ